MAANAPAGLLAQSEVIAADNRARQMVPRGASRPQDSRQGSEPKSTAEENRMLKRRIRILAVTGGTIVAAALVTLGTTAASAATTAASATGHVTAPRAAQAAADPSGCVTENFSQADDGSVKEPCVNYAQILLNDLYYYEEQHPIPEDRTYLGVNQLLTVDGFYGPDTAGVVGFFQKTWDVTPFDQILGPKTWDKLCYEDWLHGYRGTYWQDAGCATESGL
jgi:hypothetical protein